MKSLIAVIACVFSTAVLAAPPPAPELSVAVSDIRQLEFTWDSVPGVTRYELWFRSAPGAQWAKTAEQPAQRAPLFRIGVPVHLLDWRVARYLVKACNPSGCNASNEVGVEGLPLTAIGFFKPYAAVAQQHFGSHIALSADGKAMAVLASETLGASQNSVVVYVYRKTTSSSGWRREARLVPSVAQRNSSEPFLGDPIAISGDGNLIALGVFKEHQPGSNAPRETGAVYLFRRSNSAWTMAQKLTRDSYEGDQFGFAVKLDDAARTLVVSHRWSYDGMDEPGTLEIYRATDGNPFAYDATLRVPPADDGFAGCRGIALSGDGGTLLRGCLRPPLGHRVQIFTGPGFSEVTTGPGGSTDGYDISYDGSLFLVQEGGWAAAYRRGPNGLTLEANLSNFDEGLNFSRKHIALSRDGKIAAVGNWIDDTAGMGPVYFNYPRGGTPSGVVVIHERKGDNRWVIRRAIKPGSMNVGWFGHTVALGNNGRILAVGAPYDPSNASGIDGDRDDSSAPERGAVWLY